MTLWCPLTFARLLIHIGFVTGHALTAATHQVPFAVAFAQIFGHLVLHSIGHALPFSLLDRRHFPTSRSLREVGEIDGDIRTRDVVDFDGQERDASALIAESEIDALFGDGHAAHFRIDDHFGVGGESAFVRGYTVYQAIRVRFPGWRFLGGRVEFVIQQTEGFFAG